MKLQVVNKLKSRSGKVSRLTVILAVLCIIAACAAVFYPLIKKGIAEMHANECMLAIESAGRKLGIDVNFNGTGKSAEEIKRIATARMKDWEDVCPDHGTIYIVPAEGGIGVKLVCGLHGEAKAVCRLNADNCLGQIREAVSAAKKAGEPVPETVEVEFNAKKYTAVLVNEDPDIYHGTNFYKELKGTVIYFAVAGQGGFGDGFKQRSGEVSFFVFADEEHCAKWDYLRSWTGDAYN